MGAEGFHGNKTTVRHWVRKWNENLTVPFSRGILEQMRAAEFDDDGLGYSDSLDNNVCSPRDIVLLLARLYRGELASRRDTDEMLELMRTSTHKRTIAKDPKRGQSRFCLTLTIPLGRPDGPTHTLSLTTSGCR